MRAAIHNFHVAQDLLAKVHHGRLRRDHRLAALPQYWPRRAVPGLGYCDIRQISPGFLFLGINGQPLVNARMEVRRKFGVQQITGP